MLQWSGIVYWYTMKIMKMDLKIIVPNVNSTPTDVTLMIHMLYMHIRTLTQCLVLIQIHIQVNHTNSSLYF
jgi:hypothetical protein